MARQLDLGGVKEMQCADGSCPAGIGPMLVDEDIQHAVNGLAAIAAIYEIDRGDSMKSRPELDAELDQLEADLPALLKDTRVKCRSRPSPTTQSLIA
jgi:hypothetical protein